MHGFLNSNDYCSEKNGICTKPSYEYWSYEDDEETIKACNECGRCDKIHVYGYMLDGVLYPSEPEVKHYYRIDVEFNLERMFSKDSTVYDSFRSSLAKLLKDDGSFKSLFRNNINSEDSVGWKKISNKIKETLDESFEANSFKKEIAFNCLDITDDYGDIAIEYSDTDKCFGCLDKSDCSACTDKNTISSYNQEFYAIKDGNTLKVGTFLDKLFLGNSEAFKNSFAKFRDNLIAKEKAGTIPFGSTKAILDKLFAEFSPIVKVDVPVDVDVENSADMSSCNLSPELNPEACELFLKWELLPDENGDDKLHAKVAFNTRHLFDEQSEKLTESIIFLRDKLEEYEEAGKIKNGSSKSILEVLATELSMRLKVNVLENSTKKSSFCTINSIIENIPFEFKYEVQNNTSAWDDNNSQINAVSLLPISIVYHNEKSEYSSLRDDIREYKSKIAENSDFDEESAEKIKEELFRALNMRLNVVVPGIAEGKPADQIEAQLEDLIKLNELCAVSYSELPVSDDENSEIELSFKLLNNIPCAIVSIFKGSLLFDYQEKFFKQLSVFKSILENNIKNMAEGENTDPVLTNRALQKICDKIISAVTLKTVELPEYHGVGVTEKGFTYIDLKPGMRINVEYGGYNYMAPPEFTGGELNGYIPASRISYNVLENREGKLSFNSWMRSLASYQVEGNIVGGNYDLCDPAKARNYVRIVYPKNVNRQDDISRDYGTDLNIAVIMADTQADMEKTMSTLGYEAENPEIHTFSENEPVVVYLAGRSVAIPEIMVNVNGEKAWVPVGTTARDVLSERIDVSAETFIDFSETGEQAENSADFSWKRWNYAKLTRCDEDLKLSDTKPELFEISWDRKTMVPGENVLDMILLKGDRITFS